MIRIEAYDDYECQNRVRMKSGYGCIHFISGGFCKLQEFRCIPYVLAKEFPLDHSLLQLYLTCRRAFKLFALDGLECKEEQLPVKMKLGCIFHKATEIIHNDKETLSFILSDIADIVKIYFPKPEREVELYRLFGLLKGYCEMVETTPGWTEKQWILRESGLPTIFGTVDQSGTDDDMRSYFIERKYSGSPDFYSDHFVADQLSTYFLGLPEAEYCIFQVVRHPALKSIGQYKNETLEELEERVYKDVIRNPAFYFINYDKKTKRFGTKYYRSQFEDEITEKRIQLKIVASEIRWGMKKHGDWWFTKNTAHCFSHPDRPCIYLPIKKTGVVSPDIYRKREKKLFR